LNQKLNPVTARINGGTLTLEAFPRKRGYEVVGVLQKTGKEPVFASHGVYPSKPSALQGMREVMESFKKNPSGCYPKNPKRNGLLVPPNPRVGMGRGIFHTAGRDRISTAISKYLSGDAKALDKMPAVKARIDRAIGQMRGATGNPSLYKSFHGSVPNVIKISYTPPKPGEKLVSIGMIEEIVYQPFGSSKRKNTIYSHKSGDTGANVLPGKMILATSQDGKRFYLLKGSSKAVFSERGIVG